MPRTPLRTKRERTTAPGRRRRVRYAVVGQGYIAQVAVLPGFAHARRNSELAGLVSDDPVKRKVLARRHQVPLTWSYEQYDECLSSGAVDAVYIALPNHMHRDFTVRAARAGIHVLCEKPMATTEEECQAMIDACEAAGVKLMIAYRLHFDPPNMHAVEIVQSGRIGEPRLFQSLFTQQVTDEDNIRLRREMGGGTLFDIGVYCVNAARYLFRAEPLETIAMSANNGEERFADIDEMTSATLRFPSERLATFTSSFGAARHSSYRIVGTKGEVFLEPAYAYANDTKLRVIVDGRARERTFKKHDQFAAELLYFSDCILADREPEPSGREGLADVRIVRAIERALRSGKPAPIDGIGRKRRPGPEQEIRRPPVKEPELVRADAPTES